jgi:hypothetical protein
MSFRIHEVPVAINLHHLISHTVAKKAEEPTIVEAEFTVKVVEPEPVEEKGDSAPVPETVSNEEKVVYRIRRNK